MGYYYTACATRPIPNYLTPPPPPTTPIFECFKANYQESLKHLCLSKNSVISTKLIIHISQTGRGRRERNREREWDQRRVATKGKRELKIKLIFCFSSPFVTRVINTSFNTIVITQTEKHTALTGGKQWSFPINELTDRKVISG